MSDMLHTLVGAHEYAADIRKSRFLAHAVPVSTPAHALAALAACSDTTATHNCWAYRIGSAYRFNDDGEPGGTAGRPILQAIEGQGIDGVLVVVARWYGGIKLGAGGLMRAYGGTAAECLRLAPRVPIVAMARQGTRCAFADLPLIKARLADLGAKFETETFDADGVALAWRLPLYVAADAQALVADISRGRSVASSLD